jgi:hypothetical protein
MCHAEIVSWASSQALLLLVKRLERGHPLQSEAALDILVSRNAPVLLLKYITQDVGAYLQGINPSTSSSRSTTPSGNNSGSEEETAPDKEVKGITTAALGDELPLTNPLSSMLRRDAWLLTACLLWCNAGASSGPSEASGFDEGDLDFVPAPRTTRGSDSTSVTTMLSLGSLRLDLGGLGPDPALDAIRVISPGNRRVFIQESPTISGSPTADALFGNVAKLSDLKRRRCDTLTSLLRLLHRMMAGRPERIRDFLIKFRAAGVIVRAVDCQFIPVTFHCLRLLKLQAKYLGPVWRRAHMHVVSAVYRFVGVEVGSALGCWFLWLLYDPVSTRFLLHVVFSECF